MNIRSLKTRLTRCESKMGGKSYLAAFEKSLSADERKYLSNAFILSGLYEDDAETGETTVGILMDGLDLDEDFARDLWLRYKAAMDSELSKPDPKFDRMTDEEITAYIEDTREEVRQMVAESWLD